MSIDSIVPILTLAAAEAADAAAGPAADIAAQPVQYETALMILGTAGILLVGGIAARILWRLRVVKSGVWVLPILVVVTGGALAVVRLFALEKMPGLYRLVKLEFVSCLFVLVLYLVARIVLPSPEQRTRRGVPPLLRHVIVIVLALVGVFALLSWTFPELDLTPLFVTSGVVSIIVGLSIQDPLSNLLAGVLMSLERPFRVGEWVEMGNTEGQVTEVTWRATKIRTRENDHVLIPNSIASKQPLINFDRPSPLHMLRVNVGVGYETPPGLAVTALIEAARRVEGVKASPAPSAHFIEYGDYALLYEARIWMDNYDSVPVIKSDLRKEIWYSFKRHGITIPFPIRDVNMRQAEDVPLSRHARLVVKAGMPRGTRFTLGEQSLTVGRDPASRVCIPDPHVSAEHAVIESVDDGHLLRDLGSRAGTVVNGRRVKEPAVLLPGDEIVIGPVTLVYESSMMPRPPLPEDPPPPPKEPPVSQGETMG